MDCIQLIGQLQDLMKLVGNKKVTMNGVRVEKIVYLVKENRIDLLPGDVDEQSIQVDIRRSTLEVF